MAVAADFLFIHVGQQEVLGLGIGIRRAGIQVAQVVGERTHIVIVVLCPPRQVLAAELAFSPGDGKGRSVGALALDRVFQRGTEFISVHQFCHDALQSSREGIPGWSSPAMKNIVYRLPFSTARAIPENHDQSLHKRGQTL
ncbi:hypothetical protein G6F59_014798 [Rhizopus arrhizus]|nr:hypothetical protein G6F59_014798 [Rhizopus arrhizus]